MKRKKPGYYTLLAIEADDHRTGIGEGMGSRASDLVALVAFQRVDRAIEELDRLVRGGYCSTSAALTHSQPVVLR
ncbi:MAG TPA: hypothetical protein VLY63_06605 [Anaerolineae bacterium]|nr:hypothetical protein [Anaerolineae bacterium]